LELGYAGLGRYSYSLFSDYDKFALNFVQVYFLLGCVERFDDVGWGSWFCSYNYDCKCAFLKHAIHEGEVFIQRNDGDTVSSSVLCYGIVFAASKMDFRNIYDGKPIFR